MRKSLSICCFLICLHTSLFSQHLPITVYNPRDGSLVNGAISIFQDSNGWMWITNGLGVVRYDGNNFKSFLPAREHTMEFASHVMEIDGEIWVAADPYPLKVTGDSLSALDIDFGDLRLVHSQKYKGVQYFLCTDGLYTLKNEKMQPFITDTVLGIVNPLATLTPLNDSLLLTYVYREALVVFNLRSKTVKRLPVPVLDIKKDNDGTVFMLHKDKGLVVLKDVTYDKDEGYIAAELFYPLHFSNEKNESFVIDKQNNIWVFVQFERLIKISPEKKVQSYTEANGLPSLWFNQLFIDREENLWIAFFHGLCKIDNTLWQRFTHNEELYSNHITFLEKYPASPAVFIGTETGLNIFADGQLYRVKMQDKPFQATHIVQSGTNFYYIRDSSLYVTQIDMQNFKAVHEKKLAGFPHLAVHLAIDQQGAVFIATSRGLYAYYNNKITPFPELTNFVRRLLVDSRNQLWLGGITGGLSHFKIQYDEGKINIHKLNEVGANSTPAIERIRALCEDKQGNILAGTRFNGLFYIKVEQDRIKEIKHFGTLNGLKSDNIWGISVGTDGAWWVASSSGLDRIQNLGSRLSISNEDKSRQVNFTDHVLATDENRIWVASHPGILVFNSNEKPPLIPFNVFVTGVKVDGTPFRMDPVGKYEGKFSYRQNNLSIEFSANTFLNEQAVLYTWSLGSKGKKEWSTPSPLHAVNYSSLRPGKYEFRVKAQHVDGRWSSNEAVFTFEVMPPFWQRGWFITLLIIFALAALYALYRYRIRQITQLQRMRNNISRNLHDDIGASLSNIHILNELAKRNAGNPEKSNEYLTKAGEDIQRISESLGDIVWNINPKYDDAENLFIRMKRYAADMLEGKDIKAQLIFPATAEKLSMAMDQRRDFYLIFKEAVNNLAKYSKATDAKVSVELKDHLITLQVEDNGIGFDMNSGKSGNGLVNMKTRAENWGGSLAVISTPGKGTKVELEMRSR